MDLLFLTFKSNRNYFKNVKTNIVMVTKIFKVDFLSAVWFWRALAPKVPEYIPSIDYKWKKRWKNWESLWLKRRCLGIFPLNVFRFKTHFNRNKDRIGEKNLDISYPISFQQLFEGFLKGIYHPMRRKNTGKIIKMNLWGLKLLCDVWSQLLCFKWIMFVNWWFLDLMDNSTNQKFLICKINILH